LVLLLLLFPDGTLLSPRWRLVAWLVVGMAATGAISSALAPGQIADIGFKINNPLGVEGSLGYVFGLWARLLQPLTVVPLAAAALSLGLRQRRARGQERQQLKWFTSSVALVSVLVAAQATLPYGSESAVPIWAWVFNEVVIMSVALVPVSAGIAILKYRLYDIDVVVNRTLVYGALTVTLAAGYFATIIAFQGIGNLVFQVPFRALFGQKSTLATIAATLAMAALFNPLRRRIQSFIDRSFFRNKYDAAKTLEEFSMKLRDETDLNALSDDLVGVVRETMQPAHVSLWLHPDPPPKAKERAAIRESGHDE
jgi:hypothetical protein